MKKLATIAASAIFLSTSSMTVAFAADRVIGKWRTESGATANITKCGSAFCISLGGKQSGKMSGGNGSYKGTITNPENGKTYKGKAWFAGKNLKMRGYSGILFSTQTWKPL